MCFHASRFAARKTDHAAMVLYHDQDELLGNRELIAKGAFYLNRAAGGDSVSKYHLEASIAYWHTIKEDTKEKWENILALHNHLLQVEYSPVAALNRTYALSKVKGVSVAIAEAEQLDLHNNHFYFTLLGELYKGVDPVKARQHFERALLLARTNTDKQTIQKKIARLAIS